MEGEGETHVFVYAAHNQKEDNAMLEKSNLNVRVE